MPSQLYAVTKRQRRPLYSEIIGQQAAYLPELYALKEQRDQREKEYALEVERIEKEIALTEKEIATAERLGQADLELQQQLAEKRMELDQLLTDSQIESNESLARAIADMEGKQNTIGTALEAGRVGLEGYKVYDKLFGKGGEEAVKTGTDFAGSGVSAAAGGTSAAALGGIGYQSLSGAPGWAGTGGGIGGAGAGQGAASTVGQTVAPEVAKGVSSTSPYGGLWNATKGAWNKIAPVVAPTGAVISPFLSAKEGNLAGAGLSTLLAGAALGPVGLVVGGLSTLMGIGGRGRKDPPTYEEYSRGREGAAYGASPGGPIRTNQMYPSTKEEYVANLNRYPWPGQEPTGSVDIYTTPGQSYFGGTKGGKSSTTPFTTGQKPAYSVPQYAIPSSATYNTWRNAQMRAMGLA